MNVLTDHDVRLILELVAERRRLLRQAEAVSYRKIAEKFGVTKDHIESIALGRRHRQTKGSIQ